MALSPDEVKKIASLAHLRLSPEEVAVFAVQLSRIVAYIDQLPGFSGLEPEIGAGGGLRAGWAEREDRIEPCLPRERFLANAPRTRSGFFVVPAVRKVVSDG